MIGKVDTSSHFCHCRDFSCLFVCSLPAFQMSAGLSIPRKKCRPYILTAVMLLICYSEADKEQNLCLYVAL